jgi:Spy/CpxP family protein refolding chaperone
VSRILKVLAIAAVVAVVGVAALSAVALAQEPTDEPPFGPFGRGRGGAPHGPFGGPLFGNETYRAQMQAAIAGALGLSVEDFEAAIGAGQTLAQIAETQGIDLADVRAAMETARQEILDQALADGLITPEQAEWMANRPAGHGPGDCTGDGPFGSGRRGFRGGFGRFPGRPGTATP